MTGDSLPSDSRAISSDATALTMRMDLGLHYWAAGTTFDHKQFVELWKPA